MRLHRVANTRRSSALTRHLLVLPALVVGLSLAITATATAQTAFQASVSAVGPKPMPCQNGAFFCGSASIAEYGPATWTWNLTALTPTTDPTCDSYTAVSTLILADGSTLVLNESGPVCAPGGSGVAQLNVPSFGHPSYASGSWTVATATGQFTGLTGTGTDTLHAAGAQASGTYSGTPGT